MVPSLLLPGWGGAFEGETDLEDLADPVFIDVLCKPKATGKVLVERE